MYVVEIQLPVLPPAKHGVSTYHPSALRQIKPHERETTSRLEAIGLSPYWREISEIEGDRNPDIELDGLVWDAKSPTGNTRRTIDNQFHRSRRQKANAVIIDMARTPRDETTALVEMKTRLLREPWCREAIQLRRDGTGVRLKKVAA